jgi:hypothetical protein
MENEINNLKINMAEFKKDKTKSHLNTTQKNIGILWPR